MAARLKARPFETPNLCPIFLGHHNRRFNLRRSLRQQCSDSQDLFRGLLPRPHTIWNADAAVAIAGESEAGQLLAKTLDSLEAIEMADAILRHGGLPLIYASEER